MLCVSAQSYVWDMCTVPLMFMWEKLIRVHSQPWYIRLPLRLPVCEHPATICLS